VCYWGRIRCSVSGWRCSCTSNASCKESRLRTRLFEGPASTLDSMTAVLASAGSLTQPLESSLPPAPSDIQDWLIPRPWLALYGNWLRRTHVRSEREVRRLRVTIVSRHFAGVQCKSSRNLNPQRMHVIEPVDPYACLVDDASTHSAASRR
jgi:hypothetical protein